MARRLPMKKRSKLDEIQGLSCKLIQDYSEEIYIARKKGSECSRGGYDLTWALATAFMFGYRNGIRGEREYRRTGVKEWDTVTD